jgi:hypothetical protein
MDTGVKNILDRSKSRGRADENQGIQANKSIVGGAGAGGLNMTN